MRFIDERTPSAWWNIPQPARIALVLIAGVAAIGLTGNWYLLALSPLVIFFLMIAAFVSRSRDNRD